MEHDMNQEKTFPSVDRPEEIKGLPADENTAFTMRTIKDILAEAGEEGLLLKSGDTQTAKVAPQPAPHPQAVRAAMPAPQQAETAPAPSEPESIGKRLTSRIFGRK